MLGHSGYSSTHSSPLSEQLDTPVQSPVMPAVEVEMPLVTDLPSELLQAVITTLTTQSKVTQVAAQNSPPPVSTPVAVGASSGHGSSGSYNRPVPPSRPIIPFDAPIQPRQYITPSATSRRDAPSLKRKADDMEDPDEMDEIAKKRLQNTMAARRSRQRKRNELKELQDTLASITAERDQAVRERDEWKAYALKMQEYARRLGAPLPGMPSN
ncbi:hypothetical protein DL96DRAFT_1571393 [Flagelloscypha sp. PMI_526]|nr:hypothetical protein DL96DRAFT_1571393 [Flagelloscypha sp. PMI_526]